MKTTRKMLAIILFVIGVAKVNAQHNVPFTNGLPCSITVGFEEWYFNGFICISNCNFGSFPIAAGNTVNYTTCFTPCQELCVWVIDIGGTPVNSGGCPNHCSMGFCDTNPCVGQSATCGAAGCLPNGFYTITHAITPTGGQWDIN